MEKDVRKAVKWYRKAAEQGHARAQLSLGEFYVLGWGVPKDLVQAYLWHDLASANGLEIARKAKDHLVRMMTSEQLAEAHQQARDWKEKHQKPDS